MTYSYRQTQLEKQMDLLINFLPHCQTKEQRFKILDEIQVLKFKIQRIDRMFSKYDQVNTFTEFFNSQMNFDQTLKIA